MVEGVGWGWVVVVVEEVVVTVRMGKEVGRLLYPQTEQTLSRAAQATLAQQCPQVCQSVVPWCHASKNLNTLCPCRRQREKKTESATR